MAGVVIPGRDETEYISTGSHDQPCGAAVAIYACGVAIGSDKGRHHLILAIDAAGALALAKHLLKYVAHQKAQEP